MAKDKKYSTELGNLKDFMQTKKDTTPIQTVVVSDTSKEKQNNRVEETKFTVHIPTALLDTIKDIAYHRKAKIKAIFTEALQEYADKR